MNAEKKLAKILEAERRRKKRKLLKIRKLEKGGLFPEKEGPALYSQFDDKALILYTKDENPRVREAACRGLLNCRMEEVVVCVFLRCVKDENPRVREAACRGLCGYEGKKVTSILIKCIEDDYWFVRMAACLSLLGRGKKVFAHEDKEDRMIVDALFKCADDKKTCVREAACEELRNRGYVTRDLCKRQDETVKVIFDIP